MARHSRCLSRVARAVPASACGVMKRGEEEEKAVPTLVQEAVLGDDVVDGDGMLAADDLRCLRSS